MLKKAFQDNKFGKINLNLSKIQENVPLKNYTTFKVGGPAEYFLIAKNKEEILSGIKKAKEFNLPLFIFGGGSNLLVSDSGVKGMVIKIDNSDIELLDSQRVYAGAGALLSKVIKFSIENSMSGIEWIAGVPNITLGGAIYGNAQAFGSKASDIVESVEVLDAENLKVFNLSNKECQFSLKTSIFKKDKKFIIVSAVLKLKKSDRNKVEEKVREVVNYRSARHPMEFPSAGSVFVNPEMIIKDEKLIKKFPELEEFNKKGVIHAGYLIEKAGLRGKRVGNAQISDKHANFIINLGNAKAKDVADLIKLAKEKVKEIFGVELEQEIQEIGF